MQDPIAPELVAFTWSDGAIDQAGIFVFDHLSIPSMRADVAELESRGYRRLGIHRASHAQDERAYRRPIEDLMKERLEIDPIPPADLVRQAWTRLEAAARPGFLATEVDLLRHTTPWAPSGLHAGWAWTRSPSTGRSHSRWSRPRWRGFNA